MRKFLWLCAILGGYIWMATTGNEQFVLEKGKALYRMVAEWFDDADLDFQVKHKKSSFQKRERPHRRWN